MQVSFNVKGQTGSLPAIGLGTVGLNDQCVDSCVEALKAGYRHLDTALSYGNHVHVGEAIRRSGVPREEIFITTKIAFCPFIDAKEADKVWLYDAVNQKGNEEKCINLCLEQLGLDYVDLLLVHNPCVSKEEYGAACLPHFFEYFNYKDLPSAIRPDILPDGSRLRDVLQKAKLDELLRVSDKDKSYNIRKKTWAALEKALSDGKCKYIGVSNYPAPLLKEMESYATTAMPAVNQVELTPFFARKQLIETANRLGTVIVAYGTGQTLNIRKNNETIQTIATKSGKSPMQVILRWNWQSGIASIPNSRSPNHIRENFAIWDFELSDEDMRQLDELDEDYPFYWDPVPAIATVDGNNVDNKQGKQGPKRPAQTPTPKSSAKKQKKLSPSALAAAILRGVTMRPSGKWQAQLYFAGKSRYIGVFDTREKAALAYEIVREKLKPEQPAAAEGTLTSKQTEAAINAARKAAFEGVNESDPC